MSESALLEKETSVMPSQHWVPACSESDLDDDTGICALVKNRQVAIFKVRGSGVYALSNYDPFGEANVLSRGIVCSTKGELTVASPLFKQHFSLLSGKCIEDEKVQLQTFETRLDKGTVFVRAD